MAWNCGTGAACASRPVAPQVNRRSPSSGSNAVLVSLGFALLAVDSAATAGEPLTVRSVEARWVDQPPVIDGHLTEAGWRAAEPADSFYRAQQVRGVSARLRTEAYVLYDETAVYVGFRCWEPAMQLLRETLTRRDTRIWADDAVEVVLDRV